MSAAGANTSGLGDHSRSRLLEDMPDDASEYSWGPGLVPPGLRGVPPSEGGMYRGTTPEGPPQIGVSRQ